MDRMRVLGAISALVGSMFLAACDSTTATAVARDIATSLAITVQNGDPSQATPQLLVLELGDTLTLSAVATNPLGIVVPAGTVSWSTTDASVVQIDASGLLTAVGVGTADVRASAGEAVSSLATTVNDSSAF